MEEAEFGDNMCFPDHLGGGLFSGVMPIMTYGTIWSQPVLF